MANIITRRSILAARRGRAALGAGGMAFAQSRIQTAHARRRRTCRSRRARRCACCARSASCSRTRRCSAPTARASRSRPASRCSVDFVGWEDITQQTAVTANTGAGPDIIIGFNEAPHIYIDKLVDQTRCRGVSRHASIGGWLPLAETLRQEARHQQLDRPALRRVRRPAGVAQVGGQRGRLRRAAGRPRRQYLDLCRKLHAAGKPPGFALGNAVGDGNGFANWLVWSHGGYLVDEDGKVAINSKETIEALNVPEGAVPDLRARARSPGATSATTAPIRRAKCWLTANGVSLYFSLKNNPATGGDRRGHAAHAAAEGQARRLADGGPHAQRHGVQAQQVPECGEGAAAVPDGEGAVRSVAAGQRRLLVAAARERIRRARSGRATRRCASSRTRCAATSGSATRVRSAQASAAANADYVMVQMCASVASGQATPAGRGREAERRAKRFFRRADT